MSTRGADLEELEALYRRRFDAFAAVARAIAADQAWDAVQDAFATAVRKRRSYRGDGTLEAWVWRLVVNAARDHARRARRRAEPPAAAAALAPVVDEEVRAAVAGLPERQRTAVFLRYYADLDYTTIAAVLGVKEGTVAATLNAAHRTLRGRLDEVRTCTS